MKKYIITFIILSIIGLGVFFYFKQISAQEEPFVPGKAVPSEAITEGGAGI